MGGQFRKDYITMDEKVVVITGANSGIGKETAMDLARRNAKIYLACRDYDRCELARQEIIQATGNTKIYNRHLDLNTLDSVRKFVEEFSMEEKHLDVLINNAGVLYLPHSITKDGCETTLQ
uniref:Short-chain dehydrogenase n=1 Tax=Phlebotomus papatasi TaxID=29031 RepID=A0A1B0DCK1_PHLPP